MTPSFRASNFTHDAGRFKNDQSVWKYIHCLGIEMGKHIEESTAALVTFIDKGRIYKLLAKFHLTRFLDIPLIFQSQQGAASGFLTVSTLFCAVAATTIQFSFMQTTSLFGVVNFTWFMSLGFSIAATVFTLLRELWKDTVLRWVFHRTLFKLVLSISSHWPHFNAPLIILFIVEEGPLGFLVVSIITFSIGLCIFAFASNQASATVNIYCFTCANSWI